MSTLKERIVIAEEQLRTESMHRLRVAMDIVESELILLEHGPLLVCDDVEVREQLAQLKRKPKC